MLQENYPWRRFWCPPDGRILRSDEGYLWEPGDYNKEIAGLDSLVEVPFLILLGEPGMGKSRTMDAWRMSIAAQIREQGDAVLDFDLRSYSSEERLVGQIFGNEDFVTWRNGKFRLHLFLDSLDEGLLRIETLSSLLAEEFLKCDAQRLAVRIACRSADWQPSLGVALENQWGSDGVKRYEIVPLTQRDIEEAAKAEGIDVSAFLRQVSDRGVGPFATKPVTLRHLLRIYIERGELPATQWELYQLGCELLCEEPRSSFARTKLKPEFIAERRMMVAGRIAALTMFGNRATILIDDDLDHKTPEDFTSHDLRGGHESVDGVQFTIGNFEIQESRNTGLFSLRGPERLGWAHQTYAEFLAAWYLTQHALSTTQLISLLVHPGDRAGKLVPQLREVAAWLATTNQEVRRRIARIEPDVLLQCDLGAIADSEKTDLVTDLLTLYDEQRDYVRDWSLYGKLHKLAHSNLGNQLRPFINDRSKKFLVRHIAIEIAEACQVSELQNDLAVIALNPAEDKSLRPYAAAAVAHLGDGQTRESLRPLAIDHTDIEGRLKGWALQALWPGLISASELFNLLDAPAEGYSGSYTTFLSSDFLEHLKSEDLPVALHWVEEQDGHHLNYYLQRIVDHIMLTAWGHLNAPDILNCFARAALSRLRRYTPIVAERMASSWGISSQSPAEEFNAMLTAELLKRRQLVKELLSLMTEPDDLRHHLALISNVLRPTDLGWMVQQAQDAETLETTTKWAKLLRVSYNPYSPDDFNIVMAACEEQPEFRNVFRFEISPIILDSAQAKQMRASWELSHRQEEPAEKPAIDPSVAQLLEEKLAQCEAGDWDAWSHLNWIMRFEADGTTKIRDSEPDLTAMPGWGNASPGTRTRIVNAAKGYLEARDDAPADWLGKNLIFPPAYAGYRALHLIRNQAPDYPSGMAAEAWKRWATIITAFPIDQIGEGSKSETDLFLISQAYANAPEEVAAALSVVIDEQDARDGFYTMPAKVRSCIDDRLGNVLLDKARQPRIRPSTFHTLLKEALEHDTLGSREFAESFLALPLSNDVNAREKTLRAVDVLLEHPSRSSWPLIWAAMQADAAFGHDLMQRSASIHRTERPYRWEHHLTDEELADLYLLAHGMFPLAEDPNPIGFHGISARELVARWREGLLHQLKSRGTIEACESVERIVRALPDYEYLRFALIDAQDLARRNTWQGVEVQDIFDLLNGSDMRLVENGEQLLGVVIESLERWQQKLHDETPAVRDLWNEPRITGSSGRETSYTPKEEEALSDIVKRHLDADLQERGVVVNREVVIRRTTGNKDGERTDIHVDAVSKLPRAATYRTVKVVIEVKGCWNRELQQAMETQLVNRYLKESSCQHGLYLVGWYCCRQWHQSDQRQGQTPFPSIAAAAEYLSSQAKALSTQGTHVEAFVIDASIR